MKKVLAWLIEHATEPDKYLRQVSLFKPVQALKDKRYRVIELVENEEKGDGNT